MGVMVVTTLNKPRGRGNRHQPWGASLLALGVGLSLVVASAARLWTVVEAEPARVGLERATQAPDVPVEPGEALKIARSLAAAGHLSPYIVPWVSGDRGGSIEAYFLGLAGDASADTVLSQALSRAPGDPLGWVRLARLRVAADDRGGAGKALRVSFLAGAVIPGAMVPRLRLGLDLFDGLDSDTQKLVLRQIRFVWILEPTAITRLLSNPSYRNNIIEALAEINEADIQNFRRVNQLN